MRFWSLVALWGAFFAASYAVWQSTESADLRRRQLVAWQREQRIDATAAALERTVELGERWLALHELPGVIEQATGIQVEFDADSCKLDGLDLGTPLSRIRGRFSARAALSLFLAPRGLGYDIRDGRIVIASADRLSDLSELQTVVYPLPQPDVAAAAVDHEAWHELVTTIVRPESWDDVGGAAHCEAAPGGLVVVQSRSAQREVRRVIEALGSLRSPPESPAPVPICPSMTPAAWQRLRAALAEPTAVAADGLPLDDLVEKLSQRHGVPILVQTRRLEEAGVSPNVPITLQLADVSLATALAWVLDDLELTWTLRDEALIVTTPEDAESPDTLLLAAHPVHDIAEWSQDGQAADYERLSDVIQGSIAPESWVDVGGPGSIKELGGWLLMWQTHQVHGQIEALLAELRLALSYQSTEPQFAVGRSPRQRQLREALARPASATFVEEPLARAMQELGEQMRIPIVINKRRLEEAGVNPAVPMTCDLGQRPLADQLRLMLEPLELAATIRGDVVLVSTPEHIESADCCPVRVYDVRPLVDPDFGVTDPDRLIDALTTLITPESWCDVGGPASIEDFRGLLVICHTDDGHEQIDQLLTALETHGLDVGPRRDVPGTVRVGGTPGDEAVEQALTRVVDVDLLDVSLAAAIRELTDRCGLQVVFDDRRLSEAGINLEAPVTLAARGIRLESALRLVLDEHGMILQVRQGAVVVTVDEGSPQDLPLIAYHADRLLDEGADTLIDTVTTVVAPETWVDVGGAGALEVVGDWLLVSQSREVHQQVKHLLAELRGDAAGDTTPAQQRVRTALVREVAVHFQQRPLGDALGMLARVADVPIVVSARRLEEAGVSLETPVTIDLPPAPLACQLRHILSPLHLALGVQQDVVLVTTPEELERESRMSIRSYDVRPLGARLGIELPAIWAADLVTTLIDSESWVDVGGAGAAREFQGRLVILHRDDVHEGIERLLAAIDRHCGPAAADRGNQPLFVDTDANPREALIESALGRQADVVLRDLPVAAALRSLAVEHGIPLVLDERVLKEAECDASLPISFSARGLRLGGALDRLLGAWNLTYAIRDRALVVTHDDDECNAGEVRLYRVTDLLPRKQVSLDVFAELVIQGTGAADGSSIDAWAEEGGASEIAAVGTEWLAVAGTLQQHHRVEDLLCEWRTGSLPPRERERRAEAARGRWQVEQAKKEMP